MRKRGEHQQQIGEAVLQVHLKEKLLLVSDRTYLIVLILLLFAVRSVWNDPRVAKHRHRYIFDIELVFRLRILTGEIATQTGMASSQGHDNGVGLQTCAFEKVRFIWFVPTTLLLFRSDCLTLVANICEVFVEGPGVSYALRITANHDLSRFSLVQIACGVFLYGLIFWWE